MPGSSSAATIRSSASAPMARASSDLVFGHHEVLAQYRQRSPTSRTLLRSSRPPVEERRLCQHRDGRPRRLPGYPISRSRRPGRYSGRRTPRDGDRRLHSAITRGFPSSGTSARRKALPLVSTETLSRRAPAPRAVRSRVRSRPRRVASPSTIASSRSTRTPCGLGPVPRRLVMPTGPRAPENWTRSLQGLGATRPSSSAAPANVAHRHNNDGSPSRDDTDSYAAFTTTKSRAGPAIARQHGSSPPRGSRRPPTP